MQEEAVPYRRDDAVVTLANRTPREVWAPDRGPKMFRGAQAVPHEQNLGSDRQAVREQTIIRPALLPMGTPERAEVDARESASAYDWAITLPGLPSMVGVARAYCRAMFADTPCAEAAELIVSELATNSLRHTPGGGRDGWFSVRTTRAAGWGRVEVADPGDGRWRPHTTRADYHDEHEEYGRGLSIVAALATRMGHSLTEEGQAMWAEISWSASDLGGVPDHL